MSMFDDQAVQLLGHTADEINELKQNGDMMKVEAIFKRALFFEGLLSIKVNTFISERIKI